MTDYVATFRTRLLHAEALVDLARGQTDLAAAGDYDGLIDSLTRKGRIIDRMTAACDATVVTQWRVDRDHLCDEVRQECELLLDRAEQMLDETLDHERSAIAAVTAARQSVESELSNIAASRKSQAGYAPAGYSPAGYSPAGGYGTQPPPTPRVDFTR